jgi:signal transduction histidine kinase
VTATAATARRLRAAASRPLTLTVRLVGGYTLLVAATLLVVIGVTALVVRAHLETSLDNELAAAAATFQRSPAGRAATPAELTARARTWLATQPLPAGQMAAVRVGSTVLTSARGRQLFEVDDPHALLVARDARWLRTTGQDGRVRALTMPIRRGDRQLGTLVLLGYERPVDETLRALLTGVGWASAIGLAFAVGLGVLGVRRNLRPLKRMTQEVETIETTGDLSRRVGQEQGDEEVVRLAAAFDRMLARLDKAFQSQRRLVADAAHELRTPLTVARGQLELAGESATDTELRRSLPVAIDELDRMKRIVDDLLTLARLDEGLKLAREPVEVELVLREALLRALLIAPREAHVETEPGLYALADPDRLLQVVTNLVSNAVQYTEPDSWISLVADARDGDVVISVSDDGPGIPPEELPHVFERLYRGRGARTSSDGSGLGLAIVASLVAAMGGAIDVRSTEGVVTTFTVRLPRAEPPAAERREPVAPVPELQALGAALGEDGKR